MSHERGDHGQPLVLAGNDLGAVNICDCGVITLSMQYLSLRFEKPAFRELVQLVIEAQRRLDYVTGEAPTVPPARLPVH